MASEMNKKRYLFISLIIFAVVMTALMIFRITNPTNTSLSFYVQDAVSKNWIWDATITIQNRSIRSYYQSDRGPREYIFTDLQHGDWKMTISAPGYKTIQVPVSLKRGENRREEPIEVMGLEIPGLSHFVMFEEYAGGDLVLEIRPIGINGQAVINHPCMDIWIGARISEQLKDGFPVTESFDRGLYRGKELFNGSVSWNWNGSPETVFRYSAWIPVAQIKESKAPFLVVDYLTIVPNPESVSKEDVLLIVNDIWNSTDGSDIEDELKKHSGDFTYFFYSSWNVEGAQ